MVYAQHLPSDYFPHPVGKAWLRKKSSRNLNFRILISPCVAVLCLVTQTLCDPMEYSLPGSSVPGDSPGKNTRVGCYALLQGNLHNPGIKPRSPALQADSLLSEPLILLISHVSKAMLKILQARLQQYMNQDLLDVQTGFRKGRGTRDQIANIHWIIEKVKEFQKNIYFCLI